MHDFLYSPEDIEWLSRVFDDERLHFFEEGGHLGNLWRPDVQERITEALMDLVERAPADRAGRRR